MVSPTEDHCGCRDDEEQSTEEYQEPKSQDPDAIERMHADPVLLDAWKRR